MNLRSLSTRILLQIGLCTSAIALAATYYLWDLAVSNAVGVSTHSAEEIAQQFISLRGYYTENVVADARKAGLNVAWDHKSDPKTIPLPASMIHDLSEIVGLHEGGIRLRLYSRFPFPNRAGRQLDDFAQKALAALEANPGKPFVQISMADGQEMVRVATADLMSAQACVDCHNTSPDSPKKDWRLGDLRGALEVDAPIHTQVANSRSQAQRTAIGALVAVAGLLVLMWAFLRRSLARPAARLVQAANQLAEGDLAIEIGHVSSDEVGQGLGALARVGGYMRRMAGVAERIAGGDLTEAIEPRSPADSFGNAFRKMTLNLRELIATLQTSARSLTEAVGHLNESNADQTGALSHQAAALQETQVTAQELKQTSDLASQKAEAVLRVAERADQVSRAGEASIEESLAGLTAIRTEVEDVAARVAQLGERTRQIGSITETVKDLADQSNMLALNAAIEAVRSGEHGKGFAVVAREIRSLADQSAQATSQVREILEGIGSAIRAVVAVTEKGVERTEKGIGKVRVSGESLRELASILKDNAAAVRQISAAVSQQNAGIVQIFTAVTDQNRMMDEGLKRVDATSRATEAVAQTAERVSELAGRHRA